MEDADSDGRCLGLRGAPHVVVRLPGRDGQVICERNQGVVRPVADVRLVVPHAVSAQHSRGSMSNSRVP